MKTYELNVVFGAIIPIEAASEEEAFAKLNDMSPREAYEKGTYRAMYEAGIERIDGQPYGG